MILAGVQRLAVATIVDRAPAPRTGDRGRSADPPDTPPPIDVA